MNLSNQKKINNYRNNEILDSIIRKTISKNSIDTKNVVPKNSIFPKNNISKNNTPKNKISKKYIKSINPVQTLELQPYLSNNISAYNEIQIDMGGRESCGGLGCAYFNIKSKNRNPIDSIIFKIIINDGGEFKSLIFHYLIYKYYENNNIDNLKYLCKLYEFGELKNCNLTINGEIIKYYAIMKNCGMNLSEYFDKIKKRNEKISIKDRLKNLLTIFKECCKAVKIIHDLEYLHLDIKPHNFLISNEGEIKIIDFGFIKKNSYITDDYFGTGEYIPNDLLKNHFYGKETTLKYHHDIFSLGCMFIELLYKYVFKEYIVMVCPIRSQISEGDTIRAIRRNYDSSLQDIKIKKDLEKFLLSPQKKSILFGLITSKKTNKEKTPEKKFIDDIYLLINFMVNSDPEKRYQNIDKVIEQINKIQENNCLNSKIVPNNKKKYFGLLY